MPEITFSIDLHCHPQYKPFGKAHKDSDEQPEAQSTSPSGKSSLWHYNPPTLSDKLLNIFLSVTKFSQTNLTASMYGRNMVKVVGLGATEQAFFKNKLGTGIIGDLIDDFAAGFGRPRINTIQGLTDYWADFMNEMKFMKECENNAVNIDGHWFTYNLPKNFNELQQNISSNEAADAGTKSKPIIVSLICAVEGLHILNCGLEKPCKPAEVKKHARDLKKLPNRPWFVTFSHHFFNELCGHARSLRKEIGKLTNQEKEINTGFTDLGLEVIDILLDNTNNDRILIDVKHMSPLARQKYFDLLGAKYKTQQIPIIISHGVCNGLPSYGSNVSNYPELGSTFINPLENVIGGDGKPKDHNLINFYDDEIVKMVNSNGIIGLQLDERRLANDDAIKNVKNSLFRNKIMHYRSELIWRQVQYIAELLDDKGLYAWGNIGIGSDYDGLVDPLNAFWTAEEYDDLAGYLERHAYNYFKDHSARLKNNFNRIDASTVIQHIFHDNAWKFFRMWY
jgi:microsomal dipeptidase-like Zn-dependent dipeptidase